MAGPTKPEMANVGITTTRTLLTAAPFPHTLLRLVSEYEVPCESVTDCTMGLVVAVRRLSPLRLYVQGPEPPNAMLRLAGCPKTTLAGALSTALGSTSTENASAVSAVAMLLLRSTRIR